MRRLFQMSISLLLASVLCAAPGKIAKETLTVDGQDRSYFAYVPEGLSPASPAPLLILLHGSGRDGKSLIKPWKKLASKEGIILAAPNALDPANWFAPVDGPDFIVKVAEAMKEAHPVDPRRVYLFGHSGGAVFALLMSCWESEYFAAASVHAGAFRNPREAAVVERAKRKIPVQLIVGTRDPFFPVKVVRFNRDYIATKGFPVELKEISGHDHNYYGISSRINRDAWTFLKDKQLPAAPQSKFQRR